MKRLFAIVCSQAGIEEGLKPSTESATVASRNTS